MTVNTAANMKHVVLNTKKDLVPVCSIAAHVHFAPSTPSGGSSAGHHAPFQLPRQLGMILNDASK